MTSKTLSQKLLEVQKEIGAIKKDATNPFYKSKYFDINSLLEQVKPILNKHGVVLLQGLDLTEGASPTLSLTTQLIDAFDGEKISFKCPLPFMPDPQKTGSAITYFRRYALQSLLALEAEDDDGNFASKSVTKKVTTPEPRGDMAKIAYDDSVPF